MYISTFKEEEIIDQTNLILKSLFILAFISPNKDTNLRINYHPLKTELHKINTNDIVHKYAILSLINPPGWNLITKNLPKPQHRNSIEEDFAMVEGETLHEYLQLVNVISSTLALN